MRALPVVGVWKVQMSMLHRSVPVHRAMFGPDCHRLVVFLLVVLFMNILMVMH